MSNAFAAPHFHDDTAARAMIEGIRWPNGPVCPHCGSIGRAYATKRPGLYRCAEAECRMDFSVMTRTVMERSKIALHKWMMGFYLMASSKKGVSAHQLHRSLGVTYQSAWFMAHRIREAMAGDGFVPLGGEGKIVEADETYYGHVEDKTKGKTTIRRKRGLAGKRPIVSLVERGGSVRSFYAGIATKAVVTDIIKTNIAKETRLHTDERKLYGNAKGHFAEHLTVKHSAGEYVNLEDRTIHTTQSRATSRSSSAA